MNQTQTKTESQHTPEPWLSNGWLAGKKLIIIYSDKTDKNIATLYFREGEEGEAKANAKMIVNAVNSYDRHFGPNAVEAAEKDVLGEALETLRTVHKNIEQAMPKAMAPSYGLPLANALGLIENVLAQTKGGGK